MQTEHNKSKVVSSLIWKFMERGGTTGMRLVIQIILARLLLPDDYGIIAIVTIFISISSVFIQEGFSAALIQKKDVEEIDYSSVLYLNIATSALLYIILFLTTPLIAKFYNEPKLVSILRILALTLFFSALNSVQNVVVARTMQFKRLFYSSLGAVFISGITGIVMAYMGFGVWALVGQQFMSYFFTSAILWFTVKWRPRLIFSFKRVKILFKFGWKLLVSALINTIYNNYYGLVIGKVFSPEMLGYYNRGNQIPGLLVNNINGSIGSVMFPTLAANQDDRNKVKSIVRRSIMTSSFIVFPAMIGLAACAESLVKILLTDKWLPSVPFMQILSLSYALWPIHTTNLQAINALGRSDIFLKLEIIKQLLGIAILIISIRYGIYVMVALEAASGLIGAIINAFPNRYLLNYHFKEQCIDVFPSLILSVIMGLLVYLIKFIRLNVFITLITQIVVGVLVYLGMAYIFKLECLTYIHNTVKGMVGNRFKSVQEKG